MAEMKNYARVNEGFDILLPNLVDFVTTALKDAYGAGDWWRKGVLDKFYEDQRRNLPVGGTYLELVHSLDFTATVRAMDRNWGEVFRRRLIPRMRSWANELVAVRNETAHRGMADMSDDDAYRALDTMARVASGIDDMDAAQRLEDLRNQLRAVPVAVVQDPAAGERAASTDEEDGGPKRATKMQRSLAETLSVGTLPSWRDLVEPQADVAAGRFKKAEFAADLSQVARGRAQSAYQDPVEFFSRTYLTDGLRSLLVQALERVSGGDGEPVMQLKTSFGGGKTHSMIALYHLMRSAPLLVANDRTRDAVAPLIREAGAQSLPKVHVACVVGTSLDAAKQTRPEGLGVMVNTMAGQICAQLALSAGKPELFDLVREADRRRVSPGSEALRTLFDAVGPCMVLLDEMVAYAKKLYGVTDMPAGTLDNFVTFVQELTEAARNSRAALVVASIPESEREIGQEGGRIALEAIEHTFGRMEAVWKPVTVDEGFAIVSKRLFKPCSDAYERDRVCRAFAAMYGEDGEGVFPPESRSFEYEERLRACYPVHPELYDRIYADWSTLPDFQRTRGVLRFMALVVCQLWEWNDRSPLIMPGSLPFYEPKVSVELTKYLEASWDSVLDSEVDGPHSVAYRLDLENTRYGRRQAGRRLARTLFLDTAPDERNRAGAERSQVMLGTLTPDDNIPTFADALSELRRKSTYLYVNADATMYWYDTRPTLAKTVEDWKERVDDKAVAEELESRLRMLLRVVPPLKALSLWPASSADVPDERQVRLVVLGLDRSYSREGLAGARCIKAAEDILANRGEAKRSFRNMLLFLACEDADTVRIKEAARRLLAWRRVKNAYKELNLDQQQLSEVDEGCEQASKALNGLLSAAYRWLLVPQSSADGAGAPVEWDRFALSSGSNPVATAVAKLADEEALHDQWSPMLLKLQLDQLLWRDRDSLSVADLWNMLCRYLYLPRLAGFEVLKATIADGSTSRDYFGLAGGVENGAYQGLTLGERRFAVYESDLLVKPAAAQAQLAEEARRRDMAPKPEGKGGGSSEGPVSDPRPIGGPASRPVAKSFNMTVDVDPSSVSRSVRQVMEEIVENLTMDVGTRVRITLSVGASNANGFSPKTVGVVRENAANLGYPVDFD